MSRRLRRKLHHVYQSHYKFLKLNRVIFRRDFVCKRVEIGHTFTRSPGTRSLGETIRTLKGPQGLWQDRENCGRRHVLLLCLGRSWWFTGPLITPPLFTYTAIEAAEFQWVKNNFPNRG